MEPLNYQKGADAQREHRSRLRLKLFGPTRREVWDRLAAEIGARHESGGWWSGRDQVVADVGQWQIVLDLMPAGKVVFTRIRAPYVNSDGFRFKVFRRHVFSDLARVLGFQDVQIGDPAFDEAFVVRGNDEPRLRRLLANSRLRELIMAQPQLCFEVLDDEGFFRKRFPDGVDELRFLAAGMIRDVDRLKLLYELFSETLHELCVMGSAYEDDPRVRL